MSDATLDLIFERNVDIPIEDIWFAWTDPEFIKKWFCPRPWKVIECEIDLRVGGRFNNVMQSPEGQKFPNQGSFLEVITNKKLVWTNILTENFTPTLVSEGGFHFVVELNLTDMNGFTHYKAIVKHPDIKARIKHEEMGFYEGWGIAFDQLIESIKILKK